MVDPLVLIVLGALDSLIPKGFLAKRISSPIRTFLIINLGLCLSPVVFVVPPAFCGALSGRRRPGLAGSLIANPVLWIQPWCGGSDYDFPAFPGFDRGRVAPIASQQ